MSPVSAACLAHPMDVRLTQSKVPARVMPPTSSPTVSVLAMVGTRAWQPYKVGDTCPLLTQRSCTPRSHATKGSKQATKRSTPAAVVAEVPKKPNKGGRPRIPEEVKQARCVVDSLLSVSCTRTHHVRAGCRWLKVHAAQPDWLPNNADDVDTTASYVVLTASARQALTPRVALEKPIATPTPNDSPGKAAMLRCVCQSEW